MSCAKPLIRSTRTKAAFVLGADMLDVIYGPEQSAELATMFDLQDRIEPADLVADPALFGSCEVMLTGWGAPKLTAELLAGMPMLRAVFYGAGSVAGMMTPAAWERELVVVSAAAANAVPVAEFTVAAIVMALKHTFLHARHAALHHRFARSAIPGVYGRTVALISLGHIGRLVAERLRAFDVKVVAYDPFSPDAELERLGVRRVSLEQAFAQGHVVSVHAPLLPATQGMVNRELLASMPDGATLINTARGAVVDEAGLIAVLRERPDLTALLDVTAPEPPVEGSPLWSLPNVVLTPHIAGSQGSECRRMGRLIVDEAGRWLAGQPLQHVLAHAAVANSSHADARTVGE